jgi:hypothetical protein
MNKELKAKWVAALRSGEFKQCRQQLVDPVTGGMCCLGVLRHVMSPGSYESLNGQGKMLAESVAHGLGFRMTDSDRANAGFVITELSEQNDGGKSFAEIADFIEANL